MLAINQGIHSGRSIAGIKLGEKIDHVRASLIREGTRIRESSFQHLGNDFARIAIPHVGIEFVADPNGLIANVSCFFPYAKMYKGKYYPGMTVEQLRKCSKKQLVIHGMIVVDGDFGVAFEFPELFENLPFDDIDFVSQLPNHMPLPTIHVRDPEWWR